MLVSFHLRVMNRIKPTIQNNNNTSPAGKKAAFKIANPPKRSRRHKKRDVYPIGQGGWGGIDRKDKVFKVMN